MRFSDIAGNGDIKKALKGMADSGRIPHAIMFHENEGCGALALALAFLQYINCPDRHDGDSCGVCASCNQNSKLIYPDIRFSFPITSGNKVSGEVSKLTCEMFSQYWQALVLENPYFLESELGAALGFEKKQGVISIAEGRAILRKLSLASVSGGYRATVIWLPERMNRQTANALLKEIEEPSDKTLFILISHSPENVLQTIFSRCQNFRVLPLSDKEVAGVLTEKFGVGQEEAQIAASVAGGSVGVALHSLSESSETARFRDLFYRLLENMLGRDYLACIETGEEIASLDSREKQKAFCTFAGDCVRKIFMIQQGLPELAGISGAEEDFFTRLAQSCSRTFCRKAADIIGRADMLLEHNVNQKIVFTNLVNRLFVSIK